MADIALCLQYWAGDREAAFELARLLADVEKQRNERAVFVFVHRRDAAPPPLPVLDRLRAKFAGVVVVAGTDPRTGYPDGCNGLWADTIKYLRGIPEELQGARWALTFEADCVPMVRDWIEQLVAKLDKNGANIQGSYQAANPHINGNLAVRVDRDVLQQIHGVNLQVPKEVAWDYWSYSRFQLIGTGDPDAIRSGWNTKKAHPSRLDELVEHGFVFLHGVKDESALRWAKSRLSDGDDSLVAGEERRDGGLYFYPDSIPSSDRQGFSRVVIPWNSPRWLQPDGKFVQTKNGSRCGDRIVYRKQIIDTGTGQASCSFLFHGRVESDGSVTELGTINNLRTNASLGVDGWDNYEDPRLFRFKGHLYVAYVHGAYSERYLTNVCLGRLDPNTMSVVEHVALPFGDNNPSPKAIEKNWIFFEEAGSLRFVYSAHPMHVVYDVKTGRRWSSTSLGGCEAWNAKYGQPRGGTPPIRFGRHWLTFFHSHLADLDCGRRYFVGAYLFEGPGNNYQPAKFTRVPLLTGSKQDGFSMPLSFRSVLFNPAVIFPGSAEYSDDQKFIKVVSGLNEYALVEHTIPVEALKTAFR